MICSCSIWIRNESPLPPLQIIKKKKNVENQKNGNSCSQFHFWISSIQSRSRDKNSEAETLFVDRVNLPIHWLMSSNLFWSPMENPWKSSINGGSNGKHIYKWREFIPIIPISFAGPRFPGRCQSGLSGAGDGLPPASIRFAAPRCRGLWCPGARTAGVGAWDAPFAI